MLCFKFVYAVLRGIFYGIYRWLFLVSVDVVSLLSVVAFDVL